MSISRAAAAILLTLAAAGCTSAPEDPTAALGEKRARAVQLASQGKQAQDAGKLREAVDLYLKSLESYDQVPGVRTNLGMALIQSKDLLRGSDLLKEEVQLFPAQAQPALANLGVLYMNARQFMVARDYFFRALELYPNDPVSLRGAVETCMATDFDEAKTLDYISRALMVERDPKVVEDYKWRQLRLEAAIKNKPKFRPGEESLRSSYRRNDPTPAPTPPAPAPAATPAGPK